MRETMRLDTGTILLDADTEEELPEIPDVDIESIPAMMEIIDNGLNTPWEECTIVPEDVYNAI